MFVEMIFLYKGRGDKYNPIICRTARKFTCDRGAIVLGMGYLDYDKKKMTPAQFTDYIEYIANITRLESLDISFTYVDEVEALLYCKSLKKLNISGTHINDVTALKNLPELASVSMWNLWLDREQIDELKGNLPNLKIRDYQWDLYETDSISRVLPRLRVKIN